MSELAEAAERLKKYHDSGDLNVYRDPDGNHDFDKRINDERQVRNWSAKLLDTHLLADLTDEECREFECDLPHGNNILVGQDRRVYLSDKFLSVRLPQIKTVGQLRLFVAAMGGGT